PMCKHLWLLTLVACSSGTRVEPTTPPPTGHHGGGMPHRFEDAASWAKHFDDPARDAWQRPDLVLAALELGTTLGVDGVDDGTGDLTVRPAPASPDGQVPAVDIEPDMVRYVTERAAREQLPNVRAILSTPTDPKLAPGTVDRILIVDTWHHIDGRPAFARALAAALRPGGKLAIVDYRADSDRGPPPEHRLPPEEIVAELRAAGMTASLSTTELPKQYIVIGTR